MDAPTDFELLIERTKTGYRARVLKSPAGTGIGPVFDPPSEDEPGDPWPAPVRRGSGHRNLQNLAPGEPPTGSFGRRLFQAVFAGSVRELWLGSLGSAGKNLRLRMRLEDDPHLLSIPWELLDDPDRGAIAVERPLVRTLEGPIIPRPLPVRGPLKILAILSCPPEMAPLNLEEEWRILDRMLGPLVADEKVVLERLVQPTPEQTRRALQAEEWQVLHFVGHGLGGALFLGDPNGGAWAVGYETLGVLLNEESLRLVVLNACEGACPGTSDPFSGVAQTLVKRGVPAVLAMQREVSDEAAIALAEHFYRALSRSFRVDAAVAEARRELYSRNEPEWAVPVLYLSAPEGNLIEEKEPIACPGKWFWVIAALVVLGAMLVAFLLGRVTSPPEPQSPPPPPPTVPALRECPSPEGLNMAFVKIGPKVFKMGQEKGEDNDEPVHDVSITDSFCLGAFEVTQEQWSLVLGLQQPEEERRFLPASGLSLQEVQTFLDRLNQREKVEGLYKLPTEAEWELAARAGSQTIYSFGDDATALGIYGNCRGNDGYEGLAPVGRFEPNPWGLYDMYGNVFEWVADWYGLYPSGRLVNPPGPTEGEKRIRRGGSWDSAPAACSSAHRSAVQPDRSNKYTGFRIVREIR